jgi:methanesulfonate monooxygenase large subunit
MELYHEWGHVVNRTTAVAVEGYHDRMWKLYPNGHGTLEPFEVEYKNYPGWKDRSSKMLPGLNDGEFRVVDIFPNTTLIARSTSLRIDTSTPIGPGKTLVEYRGLGIKGESAEDRAMRQKHHNQLWGPLGRNVPEDVLFVEKVERTNRNGAAQFGLIARSEGGKSQDDEVVRGFYQEWKQYVGRQPEDIKQAVVSISPEPATHQKNTDR